MSEQDTAPRLAFILGDQLSHDISSLAALDKARDHVLMVEVVEECTYVRHHPKKIALILSAMRHFAEELRADGWQVRYVRLEDDGNAGTFTGELGRAVDDLGIGEVHITEPGEYRVLQSLQGWANAAFDGRLTWHDDTRFFCTRDGFADWAEGRKQLRMEYFYREMRKSTGLLMGDDNKPLGGKWNYDHDNRKKLPAQADMLDRWADPVSFEPDEITQDVLEMVERRFDDHFGDLHPFDYAVTAEQAREQADLFFSRNIERFGDYQDAMKRGEPNLYHSFVAQYLNIGLLDPRWLCERAAQAHEKDDAPLNAVEGFIRQILGWREYVRGIYWLKMPDYAETNELGASRDLPGFYWTGKTDMACVADVVTQTRKHAYAHHIQRLMVTGNLGLLLGVDPKQLNEWYLVVYADAFEWVELPNVQGMVCHADGGYLGSKPYAASGAYINRMSDYCKSCRYRPDHKTGDTACPMTTLYWNFLIEQEDRLKSNPRMGLIYKHVDKMDADQRDQITKQATEFIEKECQPHEW
ncbi:MAG: cryptochrome/photolyase family protein [Alphaproteobacteria bacterium]